MEQSKWSTKRWGITISPVALTFSREGETLTISGSETQGLALQNSAFRRQICGPHVSPIRVPGLRRSEARALRDAVRRLSISKPLSEALKWHHKATRTFNHHINEQIWIPRETIELLDRERPERELLKLVRRLKCLNLLAPNELAAVTFVDADLELISHQVNQWILGAELQTEAKFLSTIEKSPLTDEQSRAVITFDNRVHVLAAAGSGKTSVMVARAAYAVKKRIVAPDRILVLAFNNAAAKELQERITERFTRAGIESSGVKASTFHAFGLSVLGKATKKKPRLASFLDQGNDVAKILEIVDELSDKNMSFRVQWDMYRLLFANTTGKVDEFEPDGYDAETANRGYRTFSGVLVKSEGERTIADFLFLGNIEFEYEKKYPVDTADEEHSQYHPDFYYSAIDTWHEHWAIGRDGLPPSSFEGYAESMAWKKNLHLEHRTPLIETTWAEIMHGNGLEILRDHLVGSGIVWDWDPDRTPLDSWATPMAHDSFAKFIRGFMAHVKANGWTRGDLEKKLKNEAQHLNNTRTSRFLDIYWQIHDAWNEKLREEHAVDFEDMLILAATHLQNAQGDQGFDLIMVDEFQDVSQARALLVQGMLKSPSRYLLAVGDDWQSINRFAGADVSIVQDFEAWFGRGPQLSLTNTFRCTQVICDTARNFIVKNPAQLVKPMRSTQPDSGMPIKIIQSSDSSAAIGKYLDELSKKVKRKEIPSKRGSVSVDILGRYNRQRLLVPREIPDNLEVKFRTVHGSKGLEADFIIIPELFKGKYGFPCEVIDDPLLQLAMPKPELFPHGEERRLFYVALTRARRAVVLIGPSGNLSPFIVELFPDEDGTTSSFDFEGKPRIRSCPVCRTGSLVERAGRYGTFTGCSNFPRCLARPEINPKAEEGLKRGRRMKCPGCETGTLVQRRSRYGPFLGCSNYPKCRSVVNAQQLP